MTMAYLFPGQNSRYPEMLQKLVTRDPINAEVLEHASDTLGRDLKAHFHPDNPAPFMHNRDVQIGVFLANHMHWQMLKRAGIEAEYSAGLSLGEFNHLVHIGALDFEDALRVLTARGEAYQNAPRGMMAAVFPVMPEEVQAIVASQGQEDKLAIAMYNTPQQCVLSGDRSAVEAAAARVVDECYADSAVVDECLPMHSPLFKGVGETLRTTLQTVPWRKPSRPYLSNTKGRFVPNASAEDFVELLSAHPWQPVRWRECMEALSRVDSEIVFVEAGPKSVLTRFFAKRWLNPRRYSTDRDADFKQVLEELKELSGGLSRAAGAH